MLKYGYALLASVILFSTAASAEVYKDAQNNINFKTPNDTLIVFSADRNAYVNGQLIGHCPVSGILRNSTPAGTVKCVGDAIKIIDPYGNELKIAGSTIKGQSANGKAEAIIPQGVGIVSRGTGNVKVSSGSTTVVGPFGTVSVTDDNVNVGNVVSVTREAPATYNYESVMTDLGAKKVGDEIKVELSNDVLFDFGKADITPAAADRLAKLSQLIQQERKGWVVIQGHTDSIGDTASNLKLSEQRAQAVGGWLVRNAGVDASFLKMQGMGKDFPVSANNYPDGRDYPEGRAQNRRVSITIQTVAAH